MKRAILVALCATMVLACSKDAMTINDAGIDAAADAAADSAVDSGAGTDSGVEADSGTGSDTGTDWDAGADADAGAETDAATDSGTDAGVEADAGIDGGGDAGSPACVTHFRCEAEAVGFECGVATADGRRYPDAGAPYCSDMVTRANCSCDLMRCTSPAPLCPGTYTARFRERMISGCNGVPGELSGTCAALWNVVETSSGTLISERPLLNVWLDFDWAEYDHEVVITTPTVVHMRVEQSVWFDDVWGTGNSARSEVDWGEVMPAP